MKNKAIRTSDLRNLFVNNPGLVSLDAHLGRFNPFSVLGVENYELRHSSMLSWLLNPSETHGFGDSFLKSVLAEAFRDDIKKKKPSSLDIVLADLSSAEIQREKNKIDLLIECPVNGWVFLIENKFWSTQHSGQLTRYKKWLKDHLKHTGRQRNSRFIFLTLNDEEPEDSDYVQLSYDSICVLLRDCTERFAVRLPEDVKIFINHYISLLEDVTGMSKKSKEMERLAKELYREHRRVIDYVVEHGQNSDFGLAAENITGDIEWLDTFKIKDQKFVYGHIGKRQFSFLPRSWYKALGEDEHKYEGCEDWWSGFPVICWFQLTEIGEKGQGDLRLFAEVGPISDHEKRSKLIGEIGSKSKGKLNIGFQAGAADPGRMYSKFLKKNKVILTDVSNTDQLTSAMEKMMIDFTKEFDAVAKALPVILP